MTTYEPKLENAQRMWQALLATSNSKAKMELTVEITRPGRTPLHQTFRAKAWDGRTGRMVTLDLNDGNWHAGVRPTKVLHVDVAGDSMYPARGTADPALLYAAKAAVRYAQGNPMQPTNGTVVVQEGGFCGHCGARLRHPASLEIGIGPECAKACGVEHHYRGRKLASRKQAAAPAAPAPAAPAAPRAPRPAYSPADATKERQEAADAASAQDATAGRTDADIFGAPLYDGPVEPQARLQAQTRVPLDQVPPEDRARLIAMHAHVLRLQAELAAATPEHAEQLSDALDSARAALGKDLTLWGHRLAATAA